MSDPAPSRLAAVAGGPSIVACNTCRAAGGTDLVAALRAVQGAEPRYAGIAVQAMACLFACAEPCAVHLRAPDKIGYVLGRFAADETAARAILDYAVAYAANAIGEVAFADWPEGVKGHFIARTPPPGFIVE